jgi:hypothetical protein
LLPASAWKNAGKESPAAAAESLMWAADSGDLEVLANSILLDAAAREKAAAILARLPESSRQTYNTPEKLIELQIWLLKKVMDHLRRKPCASDGRPEDIDSH